jgi:hypothetical protein
MIADLFTGIVLMNALKAMNPNELTNIALLILPTIVVQQDNEYVTLVYKKIQFLFGREYNSWEIVKNGFTEQEAEYLQDIGFHRPDQNAFQAWGTIKP